MLHKSTSSTTPTINTADPRPSPQHEYTPPTQLLTPNSQAQQTLQTHHKLLHLLHHRNRNQHRRSTWYRHFNVLRREVKKLCTDLNVELGSGFRCTPLRSLNRRKTNGKKRGSTVNLKGKRDHGWGKANRKDDRERMPDVSTERLRGWIARELVQRCYVAFTSLLHTPSSASLALVLVAVLARIANVTGVTAYLASAVHQEKEKAPVDSQIAEGLGQFEEVSVQAAMEHCLVAGHEKDHEEIEDGEDVGVVVDMDVEAEGAPAIAEAPEVTLSTTETMIEEDDTTQRKRKKRRKKGNAIDEIFAGLA